ncbi:MAG: DUF58 domain-containing protein [Pseudomonadota bacterium]
MILPDLSELVALRGCAQGLSLSARKTSSARLQGSHRSAQHGRGLEFEEVRLYASGDDTRSIDWRVTARRGRPHTKLFREERERPVWLVAELHPGLFFGSKLQLKSALLLRAAAVLSWITVLNGDRLGAIITQGSNTAPLILAPRSREAGVLPVLQALVEAQPRQPAATTPDSTKLNDALTTLRSLIKPGSLVLIVSDFSHLDEATQASLSTIAMQCDTQLWWITDPLEREGLPSGLYRAGLPDQIRWLDGDTTRVNWQLAWKQREKRLEDVSQRLNLPLTHLSTANPVTETLPALLRG